MKITIRIKNLFRRKGRKEIITNETQEKLNQLGDNIIKKQNKTLKEINNFRQYDNKKIHRENNRVFNKRF